MERVINSDVEFNLFKILDVISVIALPLQVHANNNVLNT
jgi:hypothetical protein